MKLVCISDTHRLQHQVVLPDGDVLIHAGDMTGRGTIDEFMPVGRWFAEQKNKFKHRIIVAGNHDIGFQKNAREILDCCFDEDIIYLEDNYAVIDGIMFYGSPWTPLFYDWAFMKLDEQLAKIWNQIHPATEVLITHSPPYSILDKSSSGECCGSKTLYGRVKELPILKHHIFGHLHHSYGEETIDDVTFHNVCSLNDQYRYQNAPQVIEL